MNWISDVPRRAIVVVAIGLGGCAAATPPAAIATVNLPSTQPDQTVAPTWPDIEAASEGAGANAPDLAAGRWYELCNTRLDSVAPQPLPPGVEGVSAVIDDWSGAVLDSRRSRLLVWGGGHGGYAGNEIYAFDPATGSWSIIWGPTPLEQIPQGPQGFDEYPDGNPGSRHTYDNLVYDVANDALWSSDGSLWQTGKSTSGTWSFDLQTNQWRRLPPNPAAQIWAQ
ncbi:MAG: hypothetical protein KJO55_00330, partial [Gammaproteobacteria bacterium]|nr:hypothetical protein [Gammaproteobacteria bacterium]